MGYACEFIGFLRTLLLFSMMRMIWKLTWRQCTVQGGSWSS
ncbi:unnamed protein product [Calypogeia fissa]